MPNKFDEEVCKENGERYPPRSLYSIVCGIQRFLEETNGTDAVRIIDKNKYRELFQISLAYSGLLVAVLSDVGAVAG